MALVYVVVLIAIPIWWVNWSISSLSKPSDRAYALQTAAAEAAMPTVDIGSVLDDGFKQTAAPTISRATQVLDTEVPELVSQFQGETAEPIYIVVTATITPTPTMTPNPYGTLHATMTELWRLAYTATPYAATMLAAPLYYMGSNECFKNCGFITATASPVINNP